ncbi:hypothetical protein Cadr_000027884 [Camelus dromedarius]|uniref:Uncharacterized protein n=1 Tax=Camelus dromedarius TaxID=9838 RepID=A0A5N4C8P5_CAMDR|nr:hypothetical protein Cadr_000027884 [Camelus dromedarius]
MFIMHTWRRGGVEQTRIGRGRGGNSARSSSRPLPPLAERGGCGQDRVSPPPGLRLRLQWLFGIPGHLGAREREKLQQWNLSQVIL